MRKKSQKQMLALRKRLRLIQLKRAIKRAEFMLFMACPCCEGHEAQEFLAELRREFSLSL